MKYTTKDFYYDLPDELIAQTPIEPRDSAGLLVYNRASGQTEHRVFRDVIDYLSDGDVLVVNDSRVLPSRLYGKKCGTGAAAELLLLRQEGKDTWQALVKPGKKLRPGAEVEINGELWAKILDYADGGSRIVEFVYDGNFYEILDRAGNMPLPPYIFKKLQDNERYQTVYSKPPGSAAAPTAGLHFTPELLDRIRDKGVTVAKVTLHVGLGTFRPVKTDDISAHKMHSESYYMPESTARHINSAKKAGRRVVAVGTTSCRTIETVGRFAQNGLLPEKDYSGDTDIFICPGYEFVLTDSLITNFHLPESSLIMLVSAFAGYQNTMSIYRAAVQRKYRFFSFGDAMLVE
ncbi:MAG: tRNA preQ1(34) S-adenosylmethionine ribosyltransferase-isomerase QueA [Oscillospiraceae bacterium]|nr:tRNA preQ1(34) S-adenosylmethionine ribosyltransferase-isomerase QueA [Oscillospiraceae bacterium]